MKEVFIYFPHLGFLGIALIFLTNAFYTKRFGFQIISLLFLGIAGYQMLSKFSESNFLHFCLDLILIGLVAYPAKLISNRIGKIAYILVSVLFLGAGHQLIENTASIEIQNHIQLDSEAELLVRFNNQQELQKWISENSDNYQLNYPVFNPQDESFLLDEYITIDIKPSDNPYKLKKQLLDNKEINHVEFNEIVELKLPKFEPTIQKQSQQSLNDPYVGNQWMADKFELDKFHKLVSNQMQSFASKETIIAILDTGIDAQHEDLSENYQSTNRAYDKDPRGHGTHCAGIVGAVTGNNIGIASWLPPNSPVKITSIKVLNAFGAGTQKTIINGIIEAADLGASVISISIGGFTNDEREKAYEEAVRYAQSKGSIVVVAAGNSNIDAKNMTPANIDGVLTITAVDKNLDKAYFANTVESLKMGLAAPGQGIYSTKPGNKYKEESGTSMSAPFVSGVVGLMKLYKPELTTEEAFKILKSTSIERNGLFIVSPLACIQSLFDIS